MKYISSENKMENGCVFKLIIRMSLPPLFSMFLQYSYNFADSAFVAGLGEDALTAVSLAFPLISLMNSASIWLGVGLNVLIARFLGEHRQDLADYLASAGVVLAVLFGLILNIAVLLVMRPYFVLFTKDEEILRLCIQYMSICAFMQIPNMVHIVIQKIFQATGNMVAPMIFQIIGVAFNFIFDPILIFGYGSFPKMGIQGAALSTVLGYTLSMIIAFIMLMFTRQKVSLRIRGVKISGKAVREILVVGLPSFIMNSLGALMVTFVNIFLTMYSSTAVAFYGAYYKAQQIIVMAVNGLIQGCLPIMSYSYGAGKHERLQCAFKLGTGFAVGMMMIGTIVFMVFPKQILILFNASDEMTKIGMTAMRIIPLGFCCNGISTMTATYMQAAANVKKSIIINLMRQLIILFPVMFVFSGIRELNGIWISFPVTEFITLVYALYEKRKSG